VCVCLSVCLSVCRSVEAFIFHGSIHSAYTHTRARTHTQAGNVLPVTAMSLGISSETAYGWLPHYTPSHDLIAFLQLVALFIGAAGSVLLTLQISHRCVCVCVFIYVGREMGIILFWVCGCICRYAYVFSVVLTVPKSQTYTHTHTHTHTHTQNKIIGRSRTCCRRL
jgi:hypothetical protein